MTVQAAPLAFRDSAEHRRKIAQAVNRVIGNLRTGRVTFANGTTSTVLELPGLASASGHVSLTPLDATAQATAFRAAYADGSVTFTHADPGADAAFSFLAVLS